MGNPLIKYKTIENEETKGNRRLATGGHIDSVLKEKSDCRIKASTGLRDQEKAPQTAPSEILHTRHALITYMDVFRSWLFGGYKCQTWDMWHTGSPPVRMTGGASAPRPTTWWLSGDLPCCVLSHIRLWAAVAQRLLHILCTLQPRILAPRADSGSRLRGLG